MDLQRQTKRKYKKALGLAKTANLRLLPSINTIPCYFEIAGSCDSDFFILQTLTFEEQADQPEVLACGGCDFKQYFIDCAHTERHLLCDYDGWTQYRLSVPKLTSRATHAWKSGVRATPKQKERFISGKNKHVGKRY